MPDYELIKRLGSGAFGEVWLVRDRAMNREIAVKFVRPANIRNPSNFYEEPHALVELRHPNIVEVYDAGTLPDRRLYIGMEYHSRGSVEDVYSGGVVPIADALRICADACRGAEHAHSRGFVHRDIKPANLLLTKQSRAKLSDFGLATRGGAGGTASPYGYVAHLAPEVFTDDLTSPSTDVYALGVSLYRLLNGDAYLPDPAALPGSIEDAIVAGAFPDRSRFRAYVPEGLRRLVRRAMHPDPHRRFATAHDLRHAVERVIPAVNFLEIPSAEVARWEGVSSTHEWSASITENAGSYRFEIARRPIKGVRVLRLAGECESFARKADAFRHGQRVLQRVCRQGR